MTETTSHNQVSRYKRLCDVVKRMNLFDSKQELSLMDQLFATRIFLLLLSNFLLIIIVSIIFINQTHTVIIQSPSQIIFEQLSFKYSDTLSCLCKHDSIRQNQFISFNPQYHPICTSQFINQMFILSLFDYKISDYWPLDYRVMVASHFQILDLLCRTVKQSVLDALEEFNSQYMISYQVLSYEIFHAQMAIRLEQLKITTIANTKHISDFLLFSIFQNGIFSGLQTNYFIRFVPRAGFISLFDAKYKTLNTTCYCSTNIYCVHQTGIYNSTERGGINISTNFGDSIVDPSLILTIPGLKVGCLPYISLFQSTLECFYNQSCINQIQKFINGFSLVLPLLPTHFEPNTQVSDLFDQLFIESWNEKINFTNYYQACSPHVCTYSYNRRFNLLYAIATVISLFGGLRVLLIFSAPFIVIIIRRLQNIKYYRNRNDQTITVTQINSHRNLKDHLVSHVRDFYMKTSTLNMFPLSSDVNDGIYSTRLYVLSLLTGIIILFFYASTSIQIQSITVRQPSLTEYDRLYIKYPSRLVCPCTRLSMSYSSIINLKPRYHQVCSSDFIKDDKWLRYFLARNNTFYSSDFRVASRRLFVILQTLCMMSNETVTNELSIFNEMQFASAKVLSRNTFTIQTSILIQQFQHQTLGSFLDLFELVRASIQLNQFITLTNTNAILQETLNNDNTSYRFVTTTDWDDNCSCSTNVSCTRPMGFYCTTPSCYVYPFKPKKIIPGLVLSCLPVDSLLASSFQCFYNISCIQMLIEWYTFNLSTATISSQFMNITPLDPTINSRFSPYTTFDKIVSELFIEDWTNFTDFTSYYKQCAPNECTYTYEERFNRAYIIATMLGIIGGVSVALRIFIPPIVKLFRRMYKFCCRRQQRVQRQVFIETNTGHQFLVFINQLRHSILTMNFYRKSQTSTISNQSQISTISNESQTIDQTLLIRREQISTRFYVILFIILNITILLFIGLNFHTHSIKISSPTESTFELLKNKYSSTFSCPCSQIAIRYSKFLSIKPIAYHQICSSYFISSNFIYLLWGSNEFSEYYYDIDVKILSTQFRFLSSFCSLAKNVIEQKIQIFSSREFISIETLTRDSFQTQINSIINNFLIQAPADFRRTHKYINDMLHTNQLHNQFFTNWNLFLSNEKRNFIMSTKPIFYNGSDSFCSCSISSTCSKSLLINNKKKEKLSGIVRGCLPIYGLRLSTLECFYNQTCLTKLANFINSSYIPDPLDDSIYTRFTPPSSTSMGTLIDELFIEIWENKSNYSDYFSICAPLTCRYTYMDKNTVLYMFTTFLGLYGGLTSGLKFLVWRILSIYWKLRQRQIIPINHNQ